jgi:L-histidine N-alpha-methyltransferase
MPVDVSPDALKTARENIARSLPNVRVVPIVRDYVIYPLQLTPINETTLVLYIGTSIGNFSPDKARTILRNLSSQLRVGDALLLGTDMVKDEGTLVAAYDDRNGVTAAFNLNILRRLNRELGADFDSANFRHRSLWNCVDSRIEMHLECTRYNLVRIAAANLDIHFTKSETIHTENSYKFTRESIRILLEDAGFDVKQTWMDGREWYAVTLARIGREKNQYQSVL